MSDTEPSSKRSEGQALKTAGDSKKDKTVAPLKTRRTVHEQQLERTRDFVERVKEDHNVTSTSELSIRLEALHKAFEGFNSIQLKIEEKDPDEVTQQNRPTYEELYYRTAAAIKVIMNQMELATNSIKVPCTSVERCNSIRLPKIELHTFSGEVTAWMSWSDQFTSLVHNNQNITILAKFHYLVSKLDGTAKATIEGLKIVSENYEVALNRLRDRFENKRVIGRKHIELMFQHPKICKPNSVELRKLIDTMNNHLVGLKNLDRPVDHWDDLIVHLITSKLDSETALKWNEESPTDRMSTLSELMAFLKKRCQIIEGNLNNQLLTNNNLASSNSNKPQRNVRALTITKNACNFCNKQGHFIHKCIAFLNLPVPDRVQRIRNLKLCENCLKTNEHSAVKCTSNFKCRTCGKSHHSLLHQGTDNYVTDTNNNFRTPRTDNSQAPQLASANRNHAVLHNKCTHNGGNILGTVIVNLINNHNQNIPCRALLDSGSQLNLISERILRIAGIKRQHSPTHFLCANNTRMSSKYNSVLTIKSRINNFSITLEATVLSHITGPLPEEKLEIENWNIPKNIKLADPLFNEPQRVDLLIGVDAFYDILSVGQIKLGRCLPVAQNTVFGWVVAGRLSLPNNNLYSNLIECASIHKDSTLNDSIKAFWQLENIDYPNLSLTAEERQSEIHFTENVTRLACGRYQVRLPFKMNTSALGQSYDLALRRFRSLELRLRKDTTIYSQYKEFMNEYIHLGHMERTSHADLSVPHYFIPHHHVLKPSSSTTKLRVVFDASSKTSTGVSLNELLMLGPAIQTDLLSTVLRFRYYTFVSTADISKMYRQILLHTDDRRFHYILWRSDQRDPIGIYQLCTVTYGTTSASFLATRALKQLCIDEQQTYPLAADAAINGFYVDDILTGANTLSEAINLLSQLRAMLSKGGFELRKWCANHTEILDGTPVEDRENFFEIKGDNAIKTLGIIWNPFIDKFLFESPESIAKPVATKRSVLSQIAQLFDPLGLISPVVVLAKIFMQQLWLLNISWDESLPQEYHNRWENFRNQLQYLNSFEIDRQAFAPAAYYELHCFSDSSEAAYGACIYVRSISRHDETLSVKLLCSKTRVAPLKKCCLPKLELCAAVIMAQLVKRVIEIYNFINFKEIFYWTDSTIVLSWLREESYNWQTFVANRVALIQELSSFSQWHHVPTEHNPADLLSRGMLPEMFINSKLWLNGPMFLTKDKALWPATVNYTQPNDSALERKRIKIVLTMHYEDKFVENIKYHNNYRKLLNVVAYMLRFKHNCSKCNKLSRRVGVLTADEQLYALCTIVKLVQESEFTEEIRSLSSNKHVAKRSSIQALAPFIDDNGIIRVGGRLRNAAMDYNNKHPMILPKSHVFTRTLLVHHHIENHHVGPQALLSIVRQRFWPVNGKAIARSVVYNCIRCSRAKPIKSYQLMADLPEVRVQQSRPFNIVGIDFCGPFFIHFRRRGTSPVKAYVSIFICFVTKAVHLELVEDLSTKAFLNALKRFISRRGRCTIIYSDNATNFVGARDELHEVYNILRQQYSQDEIIRECADNGIIWKHIPPRSPHFGGLWEAAVKSFKFHLKRVVNNSSLTFAEFNTLIIQIEAILNSRPITPVPENANDMPALTPGHFIIGTALNAIPDPDVREVENVNRLQRYQQLQWYFQQFWDRWYKDYLQSLQYRTKWTRRGVALNVGDIVILQEENIPPLQWKLGRITQLHPGEDGITRAVTIKTSNGEVQRATAKIRRLPVEGAMSPQRGVYVRQIIAPY